MHTIRKARNRYSPKILVGILKVKKKLIRLNQMWKDGVKIGLEKISCEDVGYIQLVLNRNRQWNFGNIVLEIQK